MFRIGLLFFSLFPLSQAYDDHLSHVAVNISQAAYCMTPTSLWNCETCDVGNTYDDILVESGEQLIFGYNGEYGKCSDWCNNNIGKWEPPSGYNSAHSYGSHA